MIIVLGGSKGGDGKSTTAINIGVKKIEKKFDPIIVDLDKQGKDRDGTQQGASELFSQNRDARKITPRLPVLQKHGSSKVSSDLLSLDKKFTHVIVDAGGYDSVGFRSALSVADIIITPMRPTNFSTNTLLLINDVVADAMTFNERLKAYLYFNQIPTNPKQFAEVNCHIEKAKSLSEESKRNEEAERDGIKFVYTICKNMLGARVVFDHSVIEGLGVTELYDVKAKREFNAIYEEIFCG